MKRGLPLLVALGAVAAVLVPYLALGGSSYEPAAVADPCAARDWRDPDGLSEVLEQIVLSALDGAACELGVSREELVLAVRSEDALAEFADERGISRTDAEEAVADGLTRAVDDAEEAGALPSLLGGLVRRAVESVPVWLLLDALDRLEDLGALLP
ncbi:MAG: hypothetical protein H0U46_01375 [Actinobacteria bacterium]|nr:hypothetical protein [Actinomycetota bacterium]